MLLPIMNLQGYARKMVRDCELLSMSALTETEKLRSKLTNSRQPIPESRLLRKPPGKAGHTTSGGFLTRLAAGIEDDDAWNFFVVSTASILE